MPLIDKVDIDDLNASLSIVIQKADYEVKLNEELSKYKKKAHLKGFRKGKTPMDFIKKAYGQSLLVNVVNDTLQSEMVNYLQEQKVQFLGQPLPSADQENVNFDIKALDDYQFKFDLGLAPEFEVKGLEKKLKVDKYIIKVEEEMIDKDLESGRKRLGKQSTADKDIIATDVIRIAATEKSPEEGREAYSGDFTVSVEQLTDEYQKLVLGKDKGLELDFNIFDLEEKGDAAFVKKYYLNLDESAVDPTPNFTGKITEINRIELAPLNQNFFDQYFGEGKIKSEEEARNLLRDNIAEYYSKQTDPLLYRELQDTILEKNEISLPDAFLKRWLVASSEKNTEETVNEEYDNFAKGLKWSLIRSKLSDQFEIKITEEDIDNELAAKARQYMGMYADDNYITTMVQRLKADQKTVEKTAEEIVDAKVFIGIKDIVTLKDKEVSMEEYENIVKEYQNN